MNKVEAGDRRGERTGAGRGKGEFTNPNSHLSLWMEEMETSHAV